MIRRGIGVGSFVAAGGGTDADAQAFITAAAITDATQQSAINTLVVDLKAYGIWTKMKALYPFVGGTASAHKFNLKDPRDLDAAFRLVFFGGGSHGTGGWTPNGTNGWAETYLKPSISLSLNFTHLSFYSRTNISEIKNDMGARTSELVDDDGILLVIGRSLNTSFYRVNTTGTYPNFSDTNSLGLMTISRTANNVQKGYRNATLKGTDTTTSSGLSTTSIGIATFNLQNSTKQSTFSSKQCAFASIGDGLTDTEAANLYTAVQAYQTTLSRNV
jgi:hypothetical protein